MSEVMGLEALAASSADDIRAAGWMVAVHNDYRQDGVLKTFWLFTKGIRCVKGEGPTDAYALGQVRNLLGLPAAPDSRSGAA